MISARGWYNRPSLPKKPKRSSVTRKAVKAASTKTFNTKVNKALTQLNVIERKQKTIVFPTSSTRGTGYETTDSSVPSVVRGLFVSNVFEHCQLTRGDQQDQFTGNKISNVRLRFSGVAVSNAYDSTNNNSTAPMEVWFVFYKNKAGLLAKGNPNGLKSYPNDTKGKVKEIFTSTYPWNREEYTIKGVKKFKLRARPKEDNDDDTVINGQTSNAPTFHRFSYNLPVAKMLKYGDSDTKPSNDYLSMGIYIMDGYGVTLDPAQQRCAIYGSYTFSYTDA
jgi:hypothetical protein